MREPSYPLAQALHHHNIRLVSDGLLKKKLQGPKSPFRCQRHDDNNYQQNAMKMATLSTWVGAVSLLLPANYTQKKLANREIAHSKDGWMSCSRGQFWPPKWRRRARPLLVSMPSVRDRPGYLRHDDDGHRGDRARTLWTFFSLPGTLGTSLTGTAAVVISGETGRFSSLA